MVVFLEKVRVNTVFSVFNPVIVEPLELCYLKTALENMNIESYLVDKLLGFSAPDNVRPDAAVLVGYNVSEQEMINKARFYKSKFPGIKIIAGGVHVQVNSEYFRREGIDYVFHSQSLKTFGILMEKLLNGDEEPLDRGVDTFVKDSGVAGHWVTGSRETLYEAENVRASRDVFNMSCKKLRYLEKEKVALIKGSIGCPFKCSYCYCRELNNRQYVKSGYMNMIEEMQTIDADYFWVVDDVLFSGRNDALEFIETVEKKKSRLKIIGYLRADFILRERDLLESLKKSGLSEVIIGFETTSNQELQEYQKATDALDYPMAIKLLKENNIDFTALFMVQPDYGFKDFSNLRSFIKKHEIEVFTISILTPVKGTVSYEKMREDLLTTDPRKFDFLHLVLKPRLLGWVFYALFYGTHLRLLKSKRLWKFMLRRFKLG